MIRRLWLGPLLPALLALALAAPAVADDEQIALVFRPAKPAPHRWYGFSSSGFFLQNKEWKAGVWTPTYSSTYYLHRPIVMHLPEKTVKVGESWTKTFTIDNINSGPVLEIGGQSKLTKVETVGDDTLGHIAGRYKMLSAGPPKTGNTQTYHVKAFLVTYTAVYSRKLGAIQSVTYTSDLQGHYTTTMNGKKTERPLSGARKNGTLKFMTRAEQLEQRRETALKSRKDLKPVSGQDIHAAIDKGVAFLKKTQLKDGSFPSDTHGNAYKSGPTALALLALLKCDVKPSDPVIQRGFVFLDKLSVSKTYELGCYAMALHALCDSLQPKKKGLGKSGSKSSVRRHRCRLSNRGKLKLRELVKKLVALGPTGAWSYGGTMAATSTHYDHSNTQYAVLGLRAAELCNVSPGPVVWQKVIDHFVKSQEKDYGEKAAISGKRRDNPRGWPYVPPRDTVATSSMTMTCAGVACLLVARSAMESMRRFRKRQDGVVREAVSNGLDWIRYNYPTYVKGYPKTTGTTGPRANGYLLYGLERAGILSQTVRFDKWDWYQDGARIFIDAQADSGAFRGSYKDTIETSFALLFLKRATVPLRVISGVPKKD